MKRPPPDRPEHDFTIHSLAWDRDIAANFARAGFSVPSDEAIRERFWVYLEFLQAHGFTSHIVAAKKDEVGPVTVIRNSDVTDDGYRFIQSIEKKWGRRALKPSDSTKDRAYLEKWLNAFRNEPKA